VLLLIDDSYNANPDSVRAAIDALAALPGRRALVLGDMGEVGANGPEFHAEVGRHAAQRGIDALWTLGTMSEHASAAAAGIATRHAAHIEELAVQGLEGFDAIVVKGSRFMRMERVVAALRARCGEDDHAA
jgi:UDP-N-acetylmuramyl pentapeptide synthase